MRSKTIPSLFMVFCVLCAASMANAANAELKIESVSQTVGLMGENLPITLTGSGFDENTKVSMYIDSGNRKAIIGSVDTPDDARSVAVSGDKAFVADGFSGLKIIDISDPKNPKIIGTAKTPDYASGVVVSSGKAFVADRYGGLQIIDISDPKNPKIIGTVDTPYHYANGIAVSGDKAFVADYTNGLQIIDISDPKNSTIIGTANIRGSAVAVSGDKAFVTESSFGLRIIDISDPKNAKIIRTVNTSDYARGVAVSGDKVFVADWDRGLQIIDISDPKNADIIRTVNTPGYACGVAVLGDKAFVADSDRGLQIIDISDPKNAKIIGTVNTPGYANGVAVSGDKAFVANGFSGLQIIDFNNLKNTEFIDFADTPDYASGVAVSGENAFVADRYSGLQIIDISDPKNAKIIGFADTPDYASGVVVSGENAFVADRYSGLQIIDISDPKNAKIIGFADTPDYASDVAVSGENAFVADRYSGLQIIDISDPKNPKIIGNVNTPGSAEGVAVSGDKAFVADSDRGLQIIDISDPKNAKIIGSADTDGSAYDVAVSGDKAFVANGYNGLQIIDISDPKNPKIIGTVNTPGYACGVAVLGDKAFVADAFSGLQIIDISDPKNAKIIGTADTPVSAEGVAVSGDKAFVADAFSGLIIAPLPVDITPLVIKNDKQISCILPSPETVGDYSLRVYNNNGNIELPGAVEFVKENDPMKAKAIIVAGDGKDNNLRNEINSYADLAYKALRYQGYTEENVYYLSSLESEFSEQVIGDATKKNFEKALKSCANDKLTSELLIYFVGHGNDGEFILNASNEKITATELNGLLNNLQDTLSIRVTVIIDACQSGSFIPKLIPDKEKKERIVITSSDSNQSTIYFSENNSFSYYFWSTVAGKTVRQFNLYDAFRFASKQMESQQTVLVDANRNGIANESGDIERLRTIGIGRANYSTDIKRPVIVKASGNKTLNGETSADFQVEVGETDQNLKVRAIIMPPDYHPQPDNPVTEYCSDLNQTNCLIRSELRADDPANPKNFTGTYNGFTLKGTYTITFKAEITAESYSSYSDPKYAAFTQTKGQDKAIPDLYEDNDTFGKAKYFIGNSTDPQRHYFAKINDEDWVKFEATSEQPYHIRVSSTNVFCDAVIEVYDADGITKLQEMKDKKNAGEDKIPEWKCPKDKSGGYFVRLRNADPNIFGEMMAYDLKIYQPTGAFPGTLMGNAVPGAVIRTDFGGSDIADSNGNFTIVRKSGTGTVTQWVPGYLAQSATMEIREDGTTTLKLKPELKECQSPTVRIDSPTSPIIKNKGESVNFKGNATDGKAPYEYFWYFGGAPNSDKKDPGDVVFDKPDNPDDVNIFSVVFYAKDADGCVGKSQTVMVKVNYVPPQPEPDSGKGGCFVHSAFESGLR